MIRMWCMIVGVVGAVSASAADPVLIAKPDAFQTLVNPNCSHCVDEAKRRQTELKDTDPVLIWTRGKYQGGAIPYRFFLNPYRVISDTYGVFVYDPDAGYARGFKASLDFTFHGWRNGVMVMKHKDGTLYSCLSGRAFDGPRKGDRLTFWPTMTSTWGWTMKNYPDGVAYHMFEKYRPVELPKEAHPDSVKSRVKPDPRIPEKAMVLGVYIPGDKPIVRAYPIGNLSSGAGGGRFATKRGTVLQEKLADGSSIVVMMDTASFMFSAFRPIAERREETKLLSVEGKLLETKENLTLAPTREGDSAPFVDVDSGTRFDATGRGLDGRLKGWTLRPVDAVACHWFAWSAEYPETTLWFGNDTPYPPPSKNPPKTVPAPTPKPVTQQPRPEAPKTDAPGNSSKDPAKSTPKDTPAPTPKTAPKAAPKADEKEITGSAEYLRSVPKHFAVFKGYDPRTRQIQLLIDGEKVVKPWPLLVDAEVKRHGWWGRAEQFKIGDRVWVWFFCDSAKVPRSILMMCDVDTEQEIHADGKAVTKTQADSFAGQQRFLNDLWLKEGLPGTVAFAHISGEVDVMLDHEAMKWGRSLRPGSAVRIRPADGQTAPIKSVVKEMNARRDRTRLVLVVNGTDIAHFESGKRAGVLMEMPAKEILESPYPSDLGLKRSKEERIDWFLASIYCTCKVKGDLCTGDFYTLAACNPNGCGMPNTTRQRIGQMIDKGLDDKQIFDDLRAERGPLLLRPHLLP